MKFTIPKTLITKDDIAILNIVAANAEGGWKRPIYFGAGIGDNYNGMQDYMRLEGTVYRLMPYKQAPLEGVMQNPQDMGFVNVAKSYDLFMNTYKWGGESVKMCTSMRRTARCSSPTA